MVALVGDAGVGAGVDDEPDGGLGVGVADGAQELDAPDAGHAVVGEDQEAGVVGKESGDLGEGGLGAVGFLDVEVGKVEASELGEGDEAVVFAVVDDEDAVGLGYDAGSLQVRGRVTMKVAPVPSSLSRATVPPRLSVRRLTMLRPSPAPVASVDLET